MARALRLQFEGALYHLCARGNRRERIFELLTILTKKGVERLGTFLFRSREKKKEKLEKKPKTRIGRTSEEK